LIAKGLHHVIQKSISCCVVCYGKFPYIQTRQIVPYQPRISHIIPRPWPSTKFHPAIIRNAAVLSPNIFYYSTSIIFKKIQTTRRNDFHYTPLFLPSFTRSVVMIIELSLRCSCRMWFARDIGYIAWPKTRFTDFFSCAAF
jgi:hypothetical protein